MGVKYANELLADEDAAFRSNQSVVNFACNESKINGDRREGDGWVGGGEELRLFFAI